MADMPSKWKNLMFFNMAVTVVAIIIAVVALVQSGDDDDKTATDMSNYATINYVDLKVDSSTGAAASTGSTDNFATQEYVTKAVSDATADTASKQYVDAGDNSRLTSSDLDNYATTAYVDTQVQNAVMGQHDIDLSPYATMEDVAAASRTAAAQRNIKIAMVSHGHDDDAYWTDNVKPGYAQAVKDMHVVGVYMNPDDDSFDDPTQMAEDIKSAAFSMVQGIATTLGNPDRLRNAVVTALNEPVPMVTYNSGLNDYASMGDQGGPKIATHIGQNEDGAGTQAGAKMASYAVTKAICIRHEASNTALQERCNAFCAELVRLKPDVPCTSAAELWSGKSDDEVKASMSSQLENEWADVNAFLVLGPKYAEIMHELIINSPNHAFSGDKKTFYGTFDTSKAIYNYIANDQMQFAISQNAYSQGYLPIVFLALNAEIGVMPGAGSPVYTGPNFIDDRILAANMVNVDYTDPVNGVIKKKEDIKIAVIAHGTGLRSTFWAPVFKGVQQAARDLGIAVEYHHSSRTINYDSEYDETENLRLIREYGPKVDGLAFSIYNGDLLEALQEQCMDNGVPCVSLNSGMTTTNARGNSGAFTHVGMDEYQAGSVGGQALIDRGAKKVVCLMYDQTNSAILKRCQGAKTFDCTSNADLKQDEDSVKSGGVTCPSDGANDREYIIEQRILMAGASCNGGSDTWTCTDQDSSISCPIAGTTSCCKCLTKDNTEQIVYRESNGEYTAALIAYFGNGGEGADADGILMVGGPIATLMKAAVAGGVSTDGKVLGLFDCGAATLREIIDDTYSFCLDQQPFLQGYLPIVLLANAIQWGEKVGGGMPIYSGPAVVGKAEAENALFYAEQGLR